MQSTVGTVVHVSQLATGSTATRFVAQYRVEDRDHASPLLGLCAVTSGVMGAVACLSVALGAQALARYALGDPNLGTACYAIACTLGAWVGGLHGAFAGAAGSAILRALILQRALAVETRRHDLELRVAGASPELSALMRFTIPAAHNGFAYLPAVWLSNALLARQPGGFDQMALFAAANSFRMIALFVPGIMNNVGMSLLSNQRGVGDERRFRRVVWANLALTALSGAVVMGGLGGWLLGSSGLVSSRDPRCC